MIVKLAKVEGEVFDISLEDVKVSTVQAVFEKAKAIKKAKLQSAKGYKFLVNGKDATLGTEVHDGDIISLMPLKGPKGG